MSVYYNFSEYLKAREDYRQIRWLCTNSGDYAFVNNEWIKSDEFYLNNPRPVYKKLCDDNPDGTHVDTGTHPTKKKK